jgi:hypothetical protein
LSALFVGLLAFFVYGCLLPSGATGGAAQRVFGMARLEERFALLAIITVNGNDLVGADLRHGRWAALARWPVVRP